ncbi:MAG TPA: MarR family transcriptional regulator [Oscillospiraceae bacterium]|nr:MarR family transcriptional regulator [Oscillospiraceae bacterium]
MENQQRDQLFAVFSRIRKTKHSMPSFDGLPQGEFIMMHMISRCIQDQEDEGDDSGVKVSDLSEHLHMSKPAASQMLNSLEDKGFIERKVTKNDRRVVLVNLTKTGNDLMEENHQRFVDKIDKIIQRFGKDDTDTLILLLDKLCNILENMMDNK